MVPFHITGNGEYNHLLKKESFILAANGDKMKVIKSRKSFASINDIKIILDDMLLVPCTNRNLLSISRLCSNNDVTVEFDAHKVIAWGIATRKVLAVGHESGGLYVLPMVLSSSVHGAVYRTSFCRPMACKT